MPSPGTPPDAGEASFKPADADAAAAAGLPTDDDLIRDLAAGREEAMGPLYARYAPIVLGMAAQAVDRATAEEIVQEVLVAAWRGARSFDSSRGSVRAWLLQIAHYRIANELRRRSRRPRTDGAEEDALARFPDASPDQAELLWRTHRREILSRALEHLPAAQRRALGLAFFEELPHGQVAKLLGVPLGTAKSRIRAGMAALRRLPSVAAALAVLVVVAGLAWRFAAEREGLARDERALAMLTSSDSVAIRVTAAPGQPEAAHATYRFRPGSPIAVVTYSHFPAAGLEQGETDRAWALIGGRWVPLGDAVPDDDGRARFIAEAPALAERPERIVVTRESGGAGAAPGGTAIVRWPADHE